MINQINKIDLNKQFLCININWAAILAFVTFWVYGYYRGLYSLNDPGSVNSIIYTIILYGIFLMFLILWHRNNAFKDTITIFNKDIIAFLLYFIIMFIFSFRELNNSLVSDQIYHAMQSQGQFTSVIYLLSEKTNIFDSFQFSDLLYILNLLALGLSAALYFIFRKRSFTTKIILLSLAFFLFRNATQLGGDSELHPPFRLFPLWFSSSILSSTDLSFRLPQFIGLVTLMWLIQRIANSNLPFISSWFLGLAIGTIPVLWHVGILAEPSIWTGILWTLLLLAFTKNNNFSDFNWLRWFSIISIFSLMRVTAFIGLIPLFLFYIVYNIRKYDLKKTFIILSPVLVMIPFVLKSIVIGTPATYIPGESSYFPTDTSSIERVIFALTSGIAPNIILTSIPLPWIFFLLSSIVLYLIYTKKIVNIIIIFLFFCTAFYVFYSIRPILWGVGRYQAEYVIPFVILGFYIFSVIISKLSRVASKILVVGFICLIIYNVYIFSNLYNINETNTTGIQIFYNVNKTNTKSQLFNNIYGMSQFPYNYKSAYNEIKNSGYAGSVYVVGVTYGVYGEIMNDFTIEEVIKTRGILEKVGNTVGFADIKLVNQVKEIKIVLFVDRVPYDTKMEYLKQNGWKEWKEFKNENNNFIIKSMIRNETGVY